MKRLDLTWRRFGRLVAVSFAGIKKRQSLLAMPLRLREPRHCANLQFDKKKF
jgi:hypothetical protein